MPERRRSIAASGGRRAALHTAALTPRWETARAGNAFRNKVVLYIAYKPFDLAFGLWRTDTANLWDKAYVHGKISERCITNRFTGLTANDYRRNEKSGKERRLNFVHDH